MVIRQLEEADLNNGLLETLSHLSTAPQTDLEDIYWDRLENTHTCIAIENNKIIGTAAILFERKFTHDGGWIGHIEDVVVHKDYQGKQIGQKMMGYLLQIAKDKKCYKIILDCTRKLVPFYEKLGYKEHNVGMRIDL